MLEFPVLLGDIGGTNARFALLPGAHQPIIALPRTLTGSHPTFLEACQRALRGQSGPRPRSALIAVATRVDAPVVRLTNAPWTIDVAEIGTELDLGQVALVNDYAPVAASLASLDAGAGDLARLGPELPGAMGAKLVLGPGTGLGAAALLPLRDRFAVQPTEAGHVDFGPSNELEITLWAHLERVHGRITAETLLSGPGLLRLHRALSHMNSGAQTYGTPEALTQAALAGTDRLAVDALRLFARLLARFAGDLTLIFGATGGVFIGSGIAPTITTFLNTADFRASFENKAPFASLLRTVPTFAILHPQAALVGLAAIASEPDRFIFDQRTWRG